MSRSRRAIVLRYFLVLCGAAAVAFPLLYLVSASFMNTTEVDAYPPYIFPPSLDLKNYQVAFDFLGTRTFVNSFIFAAGVVVIQGSLGLAAGFALAHIRFRFSRLLLLLFIIPFFVPANSEIVPLFVVTRQLGILSTYPGLIIPICGSTAFATLLFRQFFAGLPSGLIEAARLDGAGWFGILLRIALPLSGPAVGAYASLSFVTIWNLYVWPLVADPRGSVPVLSVAVAPFAMRDYETPSLQGGVGFAACVLSVLPVLAIFLVFQRLMVRQIVGTGLE